tara:strand:+ start:445 stop:936 length:492 start_codon:yes stop_codon:yes gene_type:complete
MKNKELTAIKAQGNNMMLVTGYWQNTDTFKMIPITEDCPYSEVIYDPNTTLLVVISKIAKTNFQMIPRLDDNGNQVRATKKKENGNPFKEQRTTIDVFTEYYIVEKEEQESFVDLFACNSESYDYKKFMKETEKKAPDMGAVGPDMILPETKIVDKSGKVIST